MKLPEIVDRTQAYYCLDCGICTGSCPVSRVTPDFSPRLMVEKVLMDQEVIARPNAEVLKLLT